MEKKTRLNKSTNANVIALTAGMHIGVVVTIIVIIVVISSSAIVSYSVYGY
jgi:hypothetical protein